MTNFAEARALIAEETPPSYADHPAFQPVPAGIKEFGGNKYMLDTRGALVPVEVVSAADQLMDETVRKIVGFALGLNDQVARYKAHTLGDVGALRDLLAADYGVAVGGRKGNITLTSFDGLMKVTVKIADIITFGPELQIAKDLVGECLTKWSSDSRPELRAVVQRAFDVDQEGRVNRSELLRLLRMDIADETWRKAMAAIVAAMRPLGTKEYLQVHRRPLATAAWEHVTIDVAAA